MFFIEQAPGLKNALYLPPLYCGLKGCGLLSSEEHGNTFASGQNVLPYNVRGGPGGRRQFGGSTGVDRRSWARVNVVKRFFTVPDAIQHKLERLSL